jgi:amino acid adenylation domain-containing protein
LIKLSAGSDVKLHIILTAALTLLLDRYTGKQDIIIGTPILKPNVDYEAEFTNTAIALRNRIKDDMSFKELLFDVRQTYSEAVENQYYPIEILIDEMGLPFSGGDFPLFDVAMVVENIQQKSHLNHVAPNIIFSFCRVDEDIVCSLEYDSSLYERATAGRITSRFKQLLQVVLADVELKLSAADILSQEEKEQLLGEFNDTGTSYPAGKTICRLFADQVKRTPLKPAVTFAGKKLTFKELDEKSGMLAFHLVKQGIKSAGAAALMVDPSPEMIIAVLGILKTGSGYVPLNPKAPVERTAYILSDCNIALMLTTGSLFEKDEALKSLQVETIFIEETGNGEQESRGENSSSSLTLDSPGNLAYVIYTSGSTGKPKGVPITHSHLSPLLHWGFKNLEISSQNRTVQNLSYYFDWSVWEIFITLCSGACLYPASDEVLLNPETCIRFITEHKISILHVTPTQYQYLLAQERKLETLKYLFIGAEKLTYDITARSLASVEKNCRVFNMYGPTEATIIAAVLEIDRETYRDFKKFSSVPIGKPAGNTLLFILDRNLHPCPLHVSGELVIGGDGIAYGYLNNPELTAEKFINFSFREFPTHRGATDGRIGLGDGAKCSPAYHANLLYKTGDLCRWQPGPHIEFLGRIDQQVKLRGFRIELGEIENRILEHEDVKEAVVIDRQPDAGDKYLCAYVVPVNNSIEIKSAELREFLGHTLPGYMIPAFFIPIAKIPLNPNGKTDRKALPDPAGIVLQSDVDYVPPETPVQESIVRIWQEVLGLPRVGIHDNFFDIGGNSLNVVRAGMKMKEELGITIPLVTMFRYTTISKLAAHLSKEDPEDTIIREAVDRDDKIDEGKKRRLQKINRRRSSKHG